MKVSVNEKFWSRVEASSHYLHVRKCVYAGELTVRCDGPTQSANCQLGDNFDGTFTLDVTAAEAGRHVLAIQYDGQHAAGRKHATTCVFFPGPAQSESESESECKCLTCNQKPTGSQLVYCTNQTKGLMEKLKTKPLSSPVSVKAVRWKGWGLWRKGFKEGFIVSTDLTILLTELVYLSA